MEDRFEQLASDAAAGLRGDAELFTDVKRELQSHLEETAAHFEDEGHSEEESAEMASKAFGPATDVAAQLLDANRRRMRLRALLRLSFAALVVPLALLLVVGYGVVRSTRLRNAPLMANVGGLQASTKTVSGQLYGSPDNADNIRRYWEAHRNEPGSQRYYAYYASFLKPQDEKQFVDAMRLGEKIEPDNGIYNLRLAVYYLHKGMEFNGQESGIDSDRILDRRAFDAGTAEVLKLSRKRYIRNYSAEIVRKRLDSLPQPVLLEDYMLRLSVASVEQFPYFVEDREIARQTCGVARILAAEHEKARAEAVMDTWHPISTLVVQGQDQSLIGVLVAQAVAAIFTKGAPELYDDIGATAKAEEARATDQRITKVRNDWNRDRELGAKSDLIRDHGTVLTAILAPVVGTDVTVNELAPARMQEHVMVEEGTVGGILALMAVALVGALLQGLVWLRKLRGAASVPLLLVPPARVVLRAMLLGVLVPMVIYWGYTRIPVVGGREYSWMSAMHWRFGAELLVLALVLLLLPAHLMRKWVRRRCEQLDIEMPEPKEEASVGRRTRGGVIGSIIVGAIAFGLPAEVSPLVKTVMICAGLTVFLLVLRYASRRRDSFGLYYGTLARSVAPVYAFSIILMSFTAQPWLLFNEARYLRQDKIFYGYTADRSQPPTNYTGLEARTTARYSKALVDALKAD